MRIAKIVTIAFCIALISCEKQPQSYEDCILTKLSGGMDASIGNRIAAACRSKFPTDGPLEEFEVLPDDALQEIVVWVSPEKTTGGFVYNGNETWSLRELTIQIGDTESALKYRVRVNVEPLTIDGFSIFLSLNSSSKLKLISAKGQRKK